MSSPHAARAKIDEKSFKKREKSFPNRLQIDEKSTLGQFRRPRALQGRVRTRLGRFLDTQMPAQSRSWGAQGEPRAARSCLKASLGHPRDAPRASGTASKTLATSFASPHAVGSARGSILDRFSVNARKLGSVFRIGFYNVFSMSDVLRIECSSNGKTSKKLLFGTRKSRPGASRGRSGEQVWAPKRPSRAKKRARSASGASEYV